MRKLIVSTYVTLDGVMSLDGDMAQKWHFPFFAQRIAELHQQAAKQRLVGQLRAGATTPRNGRARVSRLSRGFRRSRSAVA